MVSQRRFVMPKGFLPNTDMALLTWATTFANRINLSPESYGLSPAQAADFSVLRDRYADTLSACAPNVRNKTAVLAKNTARTILKQRASQLSSIIKGQDVSDAQRAGLGLNVRAMPTRSPIP